MEEQAGTAPSSGAWQDVLEVSKAQIARGESVALLPILDRLRSAAERLEAQQGLNADGALVNAIP